MKKFLWGMAVAIVIMLLIPALIFGTGMFNIAATQEPGYLETFASQWALMASVSQRAPETENPYTGDRSALDEGLEHYRQMCLQCHGAPGLEKFDFAKGLNPPAPAMEEILDDFTDGEMFWVTKHGIRLSGMPAFGFTHNEEQIWKIVAFARHLPNMTEEEREKLASHPKTAPTDAPVEPLSNEGMEDALDHLETITDDPEEEEMRDPTTSTEETPAEVSEESPLTPLGEEEEVLDATSQLESATSDLPSGS
jgi:mono/diheme cytochrome c family protein